jgi:hypothetical protein
MRLLLPRPIRRLLLPVDVGGAHRTRRPLFALAAIVGIVVAPFTPRRRVLRVACVRDALLPDRTGRHDGARYPLAP